MLAIGPTGFAHRPAVTARHSSALSNITGSHSCPLCCLVRLESPFTSLQRFSGRRRTRTAGRIRTDDDLKSAGAALFFGGVTVKKYAKGKPVKVSKYSMDKWRKRVRNFDDQGTLTSDKTFDKDGNEVN